MIGVVKRLAVAGAALECSLSKVDILLYSIEFLFCVLDLLIHKALNLTYDSRLIICSDFKLLSGTISELATSLDEESSAT